MRGGRSWTVCIAAVSVLLCASCSGRVTASAPPPSGVPSTTASSSAPPSSSVPPSSSSAPPSTTAAAGYDLNGAAPCSLLSASNATSLGIPGKGIAQRNEVLGNAPMCAYQGSSGHLGLLLTAVTDHGIESFGPGEVAGKISKIDVSGLTAYQNRPTDAPPGSNFCTVTVGVRSGQALDVVFHEDAVEQSIGQPALCAKAKQAAQFAIGGLSRH